MLRFYSCFLVRIFGIFYDSEVAGGDVVFVGAEDEDEDASF